MNNEKLKIVENANIQELANKSLGIFVESVQHTLKTKKVFYLAISGGKTPRIFYQLLGTDKRSLELQWDKIELFWVDERCVKPDSADSNYKLAADTFLKTVPIPQKNIHRINGEYEDYSQTVIQYDAELRKVFKVKRGEIPVFDLMILGMGSDGHIGSLLPNSYALFDTDDIVTVVYQMCGGLNRITLTHPVMCEAKQLFVIISGEEKAEIVRDVFVNEPDEIKYPVHTLWPILDKVVWLIDSQAGKYL